MVTMKMIQTIKRKVTESYMKELKTNFLHYVTHNVKAWKNSTKEQQEEAWTIYLKAKGLI